MPNGESQPTNPGGAFDPFAPENLKVEPTELWTPPETLNPNVARMAWAMFLKLWESWVAQPSPGQSAKSRVDEAAYAYRHCIDVAKALEDINQDPGGEQV